MNWESLSFLWILRVKLHLALVISFARKLLLMEIMLVLFKELLNFYDFKKLLSFSARERGFCV